MGEKFEGFLSNYFGDSYDAGVSEKWKDIIWGIRYYFEDGRVGGFSSLYCSKTWNDETLENEADLEIFDLLLNIDIKNGANTSQIVRTLCTDGAFEAVKVRKISSFFMRFLLWSFLLQVIHK